MIDTKNILIDWAREGVCQITLNRPKVKNALDDKMINELQRHLISLTDDPKLRVLILSGSGDSFCTGADLNWMKKSVNFSREENIEDAKTFGNMLETLDKIPRPTIAKINGHSFGGGLGILSSCDFSIASRNSKFCFSEVKLGMIPAMISPYVIRSIGKKTSKRLFLTGEIFDSEYAYLINLIDKVVDESNLEKEVSNLVDLLLKGAPEAQGSIKELVSLVSDKPINSVMTVSTSEKIAEKRISAEGQEGMAAFFEKRAPYWQK